MMDGRGGSQRWLRKKGRRVWCRIGIQQKTEGIYEIIKRIAHIAALY
ncbi:MAG: hypothetical protein HFI91_12505 [Lachnospiraceae bacterium]|nr:hypothetical protein [Lachnospiraceae bacterium]